MPGLAEGLFFHQSPVTNHESPFRRRRSSRSLPSLMVHAIIYGMRIKIDKAGRIVLPKPVRERLHLRAGAELELEHRSEGLSLKPVERGPSMVLEKGIWVHLGQLPRGLHWDELIRRPHLRRPPSAVRKKGCLRAHLHL